MSPNSTSLKNFKAFQTSKKSSYNKCLIGAERTRAIMMKNNDNRDFFDFTCFRHAKIRLEILRTALRALPKVFSIAYSWWNVAFRGPGSDLIQYNWGER